MDLKGDPYFEKFLKAVTGLSDINNIRHNVIDFVIKFDNTIRSSSEVGQSGDGTVKTYKASYRIENNKVFIDENNFDKSMYIFLKYLTIGVKDIKDYTSYPPVNLNVYYNNSLFERSLAVAGLSLPTLLLQDDKLGCTFSLSEIRRLFPNHSVSEQEFNYRISNSIGKIFDLREAKSEDLKAFKPKSYYESKVSDIKTNKTLDRANEFVETYLDINSKELTKILYNNLLCFADIVRQKILQTFGETAVNNIITLGALYEICKSFEFKKCNLSERMKFCDIYNENYEDILKRLYLKSSKITRKEIANYPNASLAEKYSEVSIFNELLTKYKPIGTRNATHLKLNIASDEELLRIFVEYFDEYFGISDRFIVEALVLVFFAFLSTSPYIRVRDETFVHTIYVDGVEKTIKIKSKHFLNYIDSRKDRLLPSDARRNYIRLFCSARANFAIELFQYINYKPTMFPNCPKILEHMRIDFWKGLDMKRLTNEEIMSVNVLSRLTEYHSNRDEKSRERYLEVLDLTV
nr:P61 [Cordyline virus 1]